MKVASKSQRLTISSLTPASLTASPTMLTISHRRRCRPNLPRLPLLAVVPAELEVRRDVIIAPGGDKVLRLDIVPNPGAEPPRLLARRKYRYIVTHRRRNDERDFEDRVIREIANQLLPQLCQRNWFCGAHKAC